jgi:hypothetical protein
VLKEARGIFIKPKKCRKRRTVECISRSEESSELFSAVSF